MALSSVTLQGAARTIKIYASVRRLTQRACAKLVPSSLLPCDLGSARRRDAVWWQYLNLAAAGNGLVFLLRFLCVRPGALITDVNVTKPRAGRGVGNPPGTLETCPPARGRPGRGTHSPGGWPGVHTHARTPRGHHSPQTSPTQQSASTYNKKTSSTVRAYAL